MHFLRQGHNGNLLQLALEALQKSALQTGTPSAFTFMLFLSAAQYLSWASSNALIDGQVNRDSFKKGRWPFLVSKTGYTVFVQAALPVELLC